MIRWRGTHVFDQIYLVDSKNLKFGSSQDCAIYWDGTNNRLTVSIPTISGTDPGRQLYASFTATGAVAAGKQLTGIQLSAIFNGSGNNASVTAAEYKAKHTTGNTATVVQLRGIVGNVDTKNATTTTAYAVEGSVDVSAGGTITASACFHGNLNNSGTVTTSYGAYLEGVSGYNLTHGVYIRYATTGITISSPTTGITIDAATTGLNFTGATTKVLAAGSYSSMLTHQNSELITLAASDTTGWILGIGSYMRATGEDGYPFAACFLVESTHTTGTDRLQGMQSMAFLGTPGGSQAAHLKTLGGDATAGMYAGWFKVGANSNCVCDSGSRVAALWVDNQMSGTVSGEEYAFFVTCGASKVDAVFGFETTSSGWSYLFYFDETAYDQDPVGSGDIDGNTADYYLKVSINGTARGIQLYALS